MKFALFLVFFFIFIGVSDAEHKRVSEKQLPLEAVISSKKNMITSRIAQQSDSQQSFLSLLNSISWVASGNSIKTDINELEDGDGSNGSDANGFQNNIGVFDESNWDESIYE